MPTIQAAELESAAVRVLVAAGAPETAATVVAGSLVLSNLKGVDSHGIVRVAQYVDQIETGLTRPAAIPSVERRGSTAHVDGAWGFGQSAARRAVNEAIDLAGTAGLALVTLAHVRHVGRLGEYAELTAAEGCIALAFCNVGPPGGSVAPFGGRSPVFGTNPLAYAIPTGSGRPVVADFSTSTTAEGKLRLARQNGTGVPPGWILDSDGLPSEDPAAFYEGGAILPAGGHKGSALALLVEILGGILAGAGCASTGADPGNGLVLVAVRPSRWSGADVDAVVDAVRDVPPLPGVGAVLVPGDLEAATEAVRRRDGIPVPDQTWSQLAEVAARRGVVLAST
jgi:LDH2 family malate/lactate/ureidoglycolate dehydrogenase